MSDPYEEPLLVRVRGKTMRWAPESAKNFRNKHGRINTKADRPLEERTPEEIEISRKRRSSRLASFCGAIESEPTVFCCLMLDKKVQREWDIDAALSAIMQYKKFFEKTYEDGWMVVTIEWKSICGYHFHLIGDFGTTVKTPKRKTRRKWEEITGSSAKMIVDFGAHEKHEFGYLTKPVKAGNAHYLLRRLGRKPSWWVFNKHNIKLAREKVIRMSGAQFDILKDPLIDEIIANEMTGSNLAMLEKERGGLNYLTSEMLNKAVAHLESFYIPKKPKSLPANSVASKKKSRR